MQPQLNYSYRILFLVITGLIVFFYSSCEKISEHPDVSKGLVKQWRVGVISVDLSAEGIGLIQYLQDNFAYSDDEAKMIYDSIVSDVKANTFQTIRFNGDKTFKINPDEPDEQAGTWSVSTNGEMLFLHFEVETEEFQVLMITANSLNLKNTKRQEDVDFDYDGTGDSTLDIDLVYDISASSNGGAGG